METFLALVGNPNCGKTTLFNMLTGSNQYVGNWPGVTVERKTGKAKFGSQSVNIVDLPGIYSLSVYSLEEVITRDYIESDEPDVIINIVDASNIERNLFLSLQLMETDKPMVIALNMMDIIEQRGDKLDVKQLEKDLGLPIVPISASKGMGIEELLRTAIAQKGKIRKPINIYSDNVRKAIDEITEAVDIKVCRRMHAIRYIEEGIKAFDGHKISHFKEVQLERIFSKYLSNINMDRDMIISDEKYKFITNLLSKCYKKARKFELTPSEKIDKIVTHRIFAIPIFLLIIFTVFGVAFGPIGSFVKDRFEYFINDIVIGGIANFMRVNNASGWAYSLVVNGILGGIGSVLSFLPEITLLFFMLSILEDTGYMSRAAFIMDRLLRRFGLSGRSFIPMLLGFGCTVPALMSARTLENERDRRLTMIITPFMSCGARLPVYAVFASAFFADNQPIVIFSIYLLGIIVAILSGILLKGFITKDKTSNFFIELPEYRWPTPKNLFLHTWERVKGFLIKAGTVLLTASIVIWFLQSFDFSLKMVDSSESIFAAIGKLLAPIFVPLGFGDWRASVSLLSGFVAKEAVVGTLGILYGVGETAANNPEMLSKVLSGVFTPLSAYSFMAFTLLYMPCIAAFSTLKREMNSWKWTLFAVSYQTAVAWIIAFIIYQAGLFLGLS